MGREYLQIFAVIFSVMIFLQDTHALIKRRNLQGKFNDRFNRGRNVQLREKRCK